MAYFCTPKLRSTEARISFSKERLARDGCSKKLTVVSAALNYNMDIEAEACEV